MNWKERYERKPMDTVKDIPIYEDGFYIIKNGENNRLNLPVSDGYIVKINKVNIKRNSVWFDDGITLGESYMWEGCYREYIVRRATAYEEKRWFKR